MKVREVIKILEQDGWYLVETRGSHRQFKHPTKPGRVSIDQLCQSRSLEQIQGLDKKTMLLIKEKRPELMAWDKTL